MALLRYTENGTPIEVTLDSDDVTIGRADECVLQIHGDPEISRLHCAIQRRGGTNFVVLDTSSRNGTFVNGVRLLDEGKELTHGDRVKAGKTRLVFYDSAVTAESAAAPAGESAPEPEEDVFTEIAREMEEGKGFHTMMNEILTPPAGPGKPKTET